MKGLVNVHDAVSGVRFTAFLDVDGGATMAEVLPSVARVSGKKDQAGSLILSVDGHIVAPNMTVRQTHMHEGSWISLLRPGQRPLYPYANTSFDGDHVQLRFVSGVNAGAVYDVSEGIMSIGSLLDPEENSVNADFMLDVGKNGKARIIPHIREGKLVRKKIWGPFTRRRLEMKSNVFIDGKEVIEPVDIDNDTEITLPECIVNVTYGRAESVPVDVDGNEGHWLFARPPKIREVVKQQKFTLPSEPQRPERMPIPILTSLMPLAMSVAMCAILKNYTYLLFGLMSPVMMISSSVSGNRGSKKRYKQQMKRFRENTKRIRAKARKAVEAEAVQSRREYPDPTQILDICSRHTAQLWNRRSTDDSWLRLRVGTGTVDSHITLEDPQKMDFERVTKWRLDQFPVTVSMAESGCVGCTGDPGVLYPVVSWMVTQMAALHSTRDLTMYLLTPHLKDRKDGANGADDGDAISGGSGVDWSFVQWLPHFTPHFGQNAVRTVAMTADDLALRISELVAMLDERKSEQKRQSIKHWSGSAVVMIMEHAHVLRSMPGIIRLLQEGPSVGMYALCVDTDERMLPEECQTVVTATPKDLRVESNIADDVFDIMPDLVSHDWLNAVAGALAPIEDGSPTEGQSAIPDHSRLLDLLQLTPTPEQIEARWAMYPRSTSCLIGESVDGPFGLDISKDGPHGLIGGTTGSGKSELLQSLVASLAVSNTPQALNFVLVDYKGGAAFKDCVQLPHTVGMVTDLDNHLVSRALVSLGAELNYREHLLAKAGAKDLEDYIDMREGKPQLTEIPRLLIVIDEFASLARELPDFVTGLVNIAQRGRSLGIHLLLATQRPGGVVSPEIRANTNLRIALRMTDVAESQDVIDAKDAALISKNTPGRAVVRLGSSSLIPFQSARVGGRYINPKKTTGKTERRQPFIRAVSFTQLGAAAPQRPKDKKNKGDVNITDLKVLVDSINEVAQREHIPPQRQPWLPALTEHLDLRQLHDIGADAAESTGAGSNVAGAANSGAGMAIPFALGDYPQQQAQAPVTIDVRSFGNMYIVGTSRSGKSTALRTIAYAASTAYSPRDLHIYCIDAGNGALSPLSAFPNVGAVALRSETQKIERLLGKLETAAKQRAGTLSKDGYSNIDEYNASEVGRRVGIMPHVFVLLDSWDGFNSVFQTYDGGSLIDRVQVLLREGPSVGVHFILTGDRTLLAGRMSVLADSKVLLRLVDSTDYMEVGMSSRDVPEKIPDGRGYRTEDGAEIQIAQIRADTTGQEEAELIRAAGGVLRTGRDRGLGRRELPFSVEQLPEEISLSAVFARIDEYGGEAAVGGAGNGMSAEEHDGRPSIPLGLGGEDNDIILFNPGSTPILPIYGTAQSGKTTALVSIANAALALGYHLVIAAPKNNALREFDGRNGVNHNGVERIFTMPSDMTEDALAEYVDDPNTLFLFDDCQLLKDIPASNWMQTRISMMDDSKAGFVVAGDAAEFPSGFGNWGSKIKSVKQGILLKPDDLLYQDLINIRLKRAQVREEMPAGRGFVHIGGLSTTMQMATSRPGETMPVRNDVAGDGNAPAVKGTETVAPPQTGDGFPLPPLPGGVAVAGMDGRR